MIFNLFLALFLCFGLAACGQKSNSETSDNQTSTHTGTTDKKPYSFYTDPVEYWKDVVEKDQKNFFKIEAPQLKEAFDEVYFNNIATQLKNSQNFFSQANNLEQTTIQNFSNFVTLELLHAHILNYKGKFYQNDYMTPFLEDAVNWCSNEQENFFDKVTAKDIYQELKEQNIKVDDFDVFNKKYDEYSYRNIFSCSVLNDFHREFSFYNKKLQDARNTSIVYQLQDSQYCREQAQNDYDCLSYLYNLTSNRKMIFFEENQLEDINWLNPAYEYEWKTLLESIYISQHNAKELKEMKDILERAAKNSMSLKDLLQYAVNLLSYDTYLFARLNVVEQPVLRLNQVEVNEPAVVVQLSEVGLAELENLDIPENNKVLARNIIKNIQQANDYPVLNVNYRTRLMTYRDNTFALLENGLILYLNK